MIGHAFISGFDPGVSAIGPRAGDERRDLETQVRRDPLTLEATSIHEANVGLTWNRSGKVMHLGSHKYAPGPPSLSRAPPACGISKPTPRSCGHPLCPRPTPSGTWSTSTTKPLRRTRRSDFSRRYSRQPEQSGRIENGQPPVPVELKPDRRSPSRPLDPSTCPECHALATPALFRTDTAVYYHCGRCAYLWCILKPVQTISNVPVFHRFDWGSFPNE